MHALTVAAAASSIPTPPVLLVVVGLVLLAAGLLLLTGDRDRTLRPTVTRPVPDGRPPVGPAPTTDPACDWSLWLEDDAGGRQPLRFAAGSPCCTYVLRVRELDPVGLPMDEVAESLVWQGRATRVGADAATTVLERDLVVRRARADVGSVVATLSLDHATGPEVTTARPPEVAEVAQLWQRHLDDLHAHGARPVPTDGARTAPVAHQRRVEVELVVDRRCDAVARRADAEVGCAVELARTRRGGIVPAAPSLVGWVELGATRVAAERPAGLDADGRWDTRRRVPLDPDRVRLVAGAAVALELHPDGGLVAPASAEAHARATASVHLRVGPTGATAASGCARCVPDIELTVGRLAHDDAHDDTSGSTPEVTIVFDGASSQLRPPTPDTGTRSWTVAVEDVPGQVVQPVTS